MISVLKKLFLSSFAIFLTSSIVRAEPSITSAVIDGLALSVSGTNFGASSATVELYDTFENGTEAFDSLEANIGSWTSRSAPYPQVLVDDGYSGAHSIQVYDTVNEVAAIAKKVFLAPVSEVFVSYWIKIPAGSYFPCATSAETLATQSCWKMSWLMYGDLGYQGENDICVPTYIGTNHLVLAGNDYTPQIDGDYLDYGISSWWVWDRWMRISTWIKADPVNPSTTPGNIEVDIFSGASRLTEAWSIVVFDDDQIATVEKKWDRINVPGWIGPGYSNIKPLYDDIYVATGDNARARIEVSNAATFAASTNSTIQIVTAWGTDAITATLNLGSFQDGDHIYLYVVDADGAVNANGYDLGILGAETNVTKQHVGYSSTGRSWVYSPTGVNVQ